MNTSSTLIESLGWTLLHFLWQGAAVAAGLWLVMFLGGKWSAQFRYNAAALALAALVVWPVATFLKLQTDSTPASSVAAFVPVTNSVVEALPFPSAPQLSESALTSVQAVVPHAVKEVKAVAGPTDHLSASSRMNLRPFFPWMVGGWMLGVAVLSLRFFFGWRVVQCARGAGQKLEDRAWLTRFENLKMRLKITRPVTMLVSATAAVPMVIGWVKPVVLVPAGLFLGLSVAQLEAILAHELAHVRRGDYLMNLCQTVVETLFFYHPMVWWVSDRLRKEREHCCDDIASALTGGALDYARALTALEEIRSLTPVPAGAVSAAGGSLLGRVRRLLGIAPRGPAEGMLWVFAAVALLVGALAFVGVKDAFGGPPEVSTAKEPATEAATEVRPGKPGEVVEVGKKYRFQFLKKKIVMSLPGKDPADPGAYALQYGAWPTPGGEWAIPSPGAGYKAALDTTNHRLWFLNQRQIWQLDYEGKSGSYPDGSSFLWHIATEVIDSADSKIPGGVRVALGLPATPGLIIAWTGDLDVNLRPGMEPAAIFDAACYKGRLSFGRSEGTTPWGVHGDVKLENGEDYLIASVAGGKRLWLMDKQGTVKCIEYDPQLRTLGSWKKDEATGDMGDMPAGVREALKQRPVTNAGIQPGQSKEGMEAILKILEDKAESARRTFMKIMKAEGIVDIGGFRRPQVPESKGASSVAIERYKAAKDHYENVIKLLHETRLAMLREELRRLKADRPEAPPGAEDAWKGPWPHPETVRTGKPGEVLEIDRKYRFQFLKDKIVMSRPGKNQVDPGAYAIGADGAWPTPGGSYPISGSDTGYVCGFDPVGERLWLIVRQTIVQLDYGGDQRFFWRGSPMGSGLWNMAEASSSTLGNMPDGVREALGLPKWTGVIVAKAGDFSVKLRDWKEPGANFNVSCNKDRLSFGRSDGPTLWIVHGDVVLEDGIDYTISCESGAKQLWMVDALGKVSCIEFDPQVRITGTWQKDDVPRDPGGMPNGVRDALMLPGRTLRIFSVDTQQELEVMQSLQMAKVLGASDQSKLTEETYNKELEVLREIRQMASRLRDGGLEIRFEAQPSVPDAVDFPWAKPPEAAPGALEVNADAVPNMTGLERECIVTSPDILKMDAVEEGGRWRFRLRLKPEGGRKMAEATHKAIGRKMALVVNGEIQSMATVQSEMGADMEITGGFTQAGVERLAAYFQYDVAAKTRKPHAPPAASASDKRKQAIEAALAFFAAPDAASKLKLLHPEDAFREAAERHFKRHPALAMTGGTLIGIPGGDLLIQENDRRFVLGFSFPAGNQFITINERDSEMWVSWKDSTLRQQAAYDDALEDQPEEPLILPAVPKPSDYYNYEFADQTRWRCFELKCPGVDGLFFGYAPIGSELLTQMEAAAKLGQERLLELKVKFPAGKPGRKQVEILLIEQQGSLHN